MMRLKALLIDDEINILRNLQSILPWEEYRVDIVGTAKNGVQALEIVKEHQPHLIFCDIRMPVMDGIDFLRELRSFNQMSEVIMLTGYQEFEYARTVLRYRVLDYVLKPIDYDALEKLFISVVHMIRTQLTESYIEGQAQEKLKDIANEKLLLDLLNGHSQQQLTQDWKESNAILEQRFILYALSGESISHLSMESGQLDEFISFISLALGSQVKWYMLQIDRSNWAVILIGQFSHIESQTLQQSMEQLYTLLSAKEQELTIAGYERVTISSELYSAWQRVSRELSMARQSLIVVKQSLDGDDADSDRHIWNSVDELIHAIKQLDRAKANRSMERLEGQIRMYSSGSLHQVDKLMNSVIIYLSKELRKYDAIQENLEQQIFQKLKVTSKLKNMTELLRSIVDEAFSEHHKKRPQVSIHVAKEYIESHLSKDIAADEVAQYLNISLSYFSTLFKQHYGTTFIEYVTLSRIERAKSMLTLSKKSISDIAKAVGYTERRYFNKVFLKKVGMLPSEYRELNNEVREISHD